VAGIARYQNAQPYSSYSSPNIIRVVKPTRMAWARHVARVGRREFWWGYLRERAHCRWGDNIKFYLKEVYWEILD
jgi:hypothetical protein